MSNKISKVTTVVTFLDQALRIPALASAEEYAAEGIRSFSRSCEEMARAGRCFEHAKNFLEHGEFQPFIESLGLPYHHAARAMTVSSFLRGLPDSEQQKLLATPHSRILELAKADPVVIEDAVESGTLEDLAGLSVRELRKTIARERTEKTWLEKRVKDYERDEKIRSGLQDETNFPAFARETKQEVAELCARINLCIESLEDLAERNLLGNPKGAEAVRFQPLVATTFVYGVGSQLARLSAVFSRVRNHHGDAVAGSLFDEHLLDARDQRLYESALERITREHSIAAEVRADERANTTAGRRGRKRGTGKGE